MSFRRTDPATARNVVLTLGVIYLVVGILGFVVPMMFGLIPTVTRSPTTCCTRHWESLAW